MEKLKDIIEEVHGIAYVRVSELMPELFEFVFIGLAGHHTCYISSSVMADKWITSLKLMGCKVVLE